jgi:hypothetical protein
METMVDGGPPQVQQMELLESDSTRIDIDRESNEHFGDQIKIKQDQTIRIGFININGLPMTTDNPKNKIIYNSITNKQINIIGLAETNRCWHKLKEKDKWKNRTRGWWESSHSTFGYNTRDGDIATTFQPGGTALISINNTCHRVITSGKDPSGLGRWTWTLYRGKHNVTLRIITAYRPCKPSTPGPNTTFSQQQRYHNRISDNRCPRDSILEDLGQCINTWRNAGNQIILMADFNDNVEGPRIQQWTQSLQLTNAISSLHPLNNEPTFHRGQTSIDGIFVSHTIKPVQGGYLPFGSLPSDHRCLWIDITKHNAFGYKPPLSVKPSARRLKSDNPTVRNKWLQIYEQFIRDNELHLRQFRLEASIISHMNLEQQKEYEDIRRLRMQGIKAADKGCRKLTMGNVPFSDKYKDITDKIELWRAVITKKSYCKYSQSKLRRLEKRTGIQHSLHCTIEEAKAKEKQALDEYWKFKKTARQHRKVALICSRFLVPNLNHLQSILKFINKFSFLVPLINQKK